MNSTSLIRQFSKYQQKVLKLCEQYPEDFNIQYHPDLSPLGWHLGHCIYTETYWIKERLLCVPSPDQELRSYYIPGLVKKSDRGKILPDHFKFCKWAGEIQRENLKLLNKYQNGQCQNALMKNHFLLHFLIQHYAQHAEIMHMVLAQRALQTALQNDVDFLVQQPLAGSEINTSTVVLDSGDYTIGAQTDFLPYDNEYPPHEFKTNDIEIAKNPISNSEFLLFMEESGYQKSGYWSQEGWHWKEKYDATCPEFWLQNNRKNWFGVNSQGAQSLDPEHPVWGINYFEAQAVTNWAGGRLPHEYEWEAAKQNGCLENSGQVWEWCHNSFHPYTRFRAFPYDGYSIPYFDDSHFVMKGASQYTQETVQRSSFRNYYQADKRHQFAGCRMVFK